MTDILAVLFLLLLAAGIAVLLERNHRRSAGVPRLPYGADPETDADLWRVRHDLDGAEVTPTRPSRPSSRRGGRPSGPTHPVHRARAA